MTSIVPTPAAPVVPQYPALGSANFNQEVYTYGTAMPGVTYRIWETAVAVQQNAAIAEQSAATASAAVSSVAANAQRAQQACDRAVEAEAAIDRSLEEGPVLTVNGQFGVVDLTADLHAAALCF